MHKIDGPTAAAVAPTPAAVSGTPGWFADGDPLTSTPATIVDADWANAVQGEILAPIVAAGLTPDKTNNAQLLAALNLLFVPAGSGGISIANPGHLYLAGGLIIQWGTDPLGSGSNVVTGSCTFPIAFPNAAFGIYGNADGVANGSWHPIVVCFDSLSTTGATFFGDTANAGQSIGAGRHVRWFAIGH